MKKTLLFIIFGLFTAVCGFAQFDIKTVAIVNLTRSVPISGKDLRTQVELVERTTGRALTQTQRQEVLDALINEQLAIQAAERDKITISENEINQQLSQLRGGLAQQLGRQPTDAEFNQAVRKESGLELSAYREQMRRQMLVQKYLMAKKESQITSLIKQPTDDEILFQFNLKRGQFVRLETVEFASIQIPYGKDAAAKTKAKELADKLIREIASNPTKFDAAAERAQSPNSGYMAWEGGSVPRNDETLARFGVDFVNTAFSLKQGQVSKLIETANDYLIVKVTKNLELKILELDDVLPSYLLPGIDPRTKVTVKNFLATAILTDRQQTAIKKATEDLVSELRAGRSFQQLERNLSW